MSQPSVMYYMMALPNLLWCVMCLLPTLNANEEIFMSTNETFDLATYIVTGFVHPGGDTEELSLTYILKCLDHISSQQVVSESHTHRES